MLIETALPLLFTPSQTKIGKQMWWKVPCPVQWMANLFMRLWVGKFKVWLGNLKIGLIFVKHFYWKLSVRLEYLQKMSILKTDFHPSPKFLSIICFSWFDVYVNWKWYFNLLNKICCFRNHLFGLTVGLLYGTLLCSIRRL